MSVKAFVKRIASALVARKMRSSGVVVGQRLLSRRAPFIRRHAGSTIEIGDDCIIHHSTRQNVAGITNENTLVTMAAGARISIGSGAGLSGAVIVAAQSITIEDQVMLGANVRIYDSDFHPLDFHARVLDLQDEVRKAPVVIRRGAWIGLNAIILKGVEIGEFAVIGAGSVVTRSVPRCTVYAGNPAKFVKELPEPART